MAQIRVPAGASLQKAFNDAKPGDQVLLDVGASYMGTFTLPPKPDGPTIWVHPDSGLPNRRINPADLKLTAKIGSLTSEPAIVAHNTSNWTFEGIELLPTKEGQYNVVWLEQSRGIEFDRCLFFGKEHGQRRVILGNGRGITLSRSHFENVFRRGDESNAFCAYSGAGPYRIIDNFLEIAGINILFGGANSRSSADVPADILVRGNDCTKRLSWRPDSSEKATVKNLFEIKSCKRAHILENSFTNNWADAQSGVAILFTVRNDEGQSPWSCIEDVVFEKNLVSGTQGIFNILGYDHYQRSERATRIRISNNLLIGSGNAFLLGGEIGETLIDHNTIFQGGNLMTLYVADIWPNGEAKRKAAYAFENLQFTNNLARHNDYGVFGENAGIGKIALDYHCRAYVFTHNVLADAGNYNYPGQVWKPNRLDFERNVNPDGTLPEDSFYRKKATDGTDLGWSGASTNPDPDPDPDPKPVDEIGPDVRISGITRSGKSSNYTISADIQATDVTRVDFYVNDVHVGVKFAKPWSMKTGITRSGAHTVSAVAVDGHGNTGQASRTFVI